MDDQLINAAETGDTKKLSAMLAAHPEKLHLRTPPYDWTLLHLAAHHGQLSAVDLLLKGGFDVNTRERGDNTYALHWAAAAGHVDVVRRLIDAGGDVVGSGDDHEMEVIGWATCWDGCDDAAHRDVVDMLVDHGARHHIFSAIAMNLGDEVRRLVSADPSALNRRMSRNENHRTALQFAVLRNRPAMVSLLVELGADALGVDGSGMPVAGYAIAPDVDRPVMEAIRAMTRGELASAGRGQRSPNLAAIDLIAALALGDLELAERVVAAKPRLLDPSAGVLHLMSKRNDRTAVRWLLAHGADASGRWPHWDSVVTPLHLAILADQHEVVGLLLAAGADPAVRDSKHDSDAAGWAEFFRRTEILARLNTHKGNR